MYFSESEIDVSVISSLCLFEMYIIDAEELVG